MAKAPTLRVGVGEGAALLRTGTGTAGERTGVTARTAGDLLRGGGGGGERRLAAVRVLVEERGGGGGGGGGGGDRTTLGGGGGGRGEGEGDRAGVPLVVVVVVGCGRVLKLPELVLLPLLALGPGTAVRPPLLLLPLLAPDRSALVTRGRVMGAPLTPPAAAWAAAVMGAM